MSSPIIGQLVFGTVITLTAKIMFDIPAEGLQGNTHLFEKPWFETFIMFVSMIGCLPLHAWLRYRQYGSSMYEELRSLLGRTPKSSSREQELRTCLNGDLLSSSSCFTAVTSSLHFPSSPTSPPSPPPANTSMILWPAVCDMIATGLMMSGLVFTTVSVCQMLRGAEVVGCMILSVYCLKRKLDCYNYIGALLCVVGITLVGLATYFGEQQKSHIPKWKELLGFVLILVAQLVAATQTVIEEFLLKDIEMDTMVVVGYEGLYGTAICLLLVMPLCQILPGRDSGSYENSVDTVVMMYNSWFLVLVQISDMISTLVYNYFGMVVTKEMSGLHKTIFETLRTVFAWAIDLMIFYWLSNGNFGERWMSSSWMQLIGFIIICSGTLTYNWTSINDYMGEAQAEEDTVAL